MKNNEVYQNKIVGSVLVVGAGIGGIQSALDLAEMGYRVYLVEKSPAIGGRMPMLDKTFPTNDCSMCILSPKLVECGRHININILTCSSVEEVSGDPGNFTVKVRERPRFVNVDKCTSCGECAVNCPVKVDDAFNQGLGKRKAIYKLYPQAYPNAYVIDREKCLRLKNPKACGKCLEACQAGAVNHDMQEQLHVLNVGAIVLCPGFELFDAELRGEFGYGIYRNVITSLQFERMLSASGPYQGHLKRPSDGSDLKKIAFIQCVGSRDISKNQGYCSSICCMYATKEAVIAKEHVPGLETTIFCVDVRAFGKDFEKYYNRARDEYGVRYVKCMISAVKELQKTNNLRLQYRTPEGAITEEDFDMVVLSVGLRPAPGVMEMAGTMGVPLNRYNFCLLEPYSGVRTLRPGIYVAGAFSGPKDIPETVMQASAAAGDCSSFLAPARNSLAVEVKYPEEKNISSGDPRVGVIVCRCGTNIGSVVDVPSVVECARAMPNVVFADERIYACSQDSQAAMQELIEMHRLNRVVVASCSPRTHKPLFQETLRAAGLNKNLFEMANIRDQCSWVHQNDPSRATEKAKELVGMAVRKAVTLEPIRPAVVEVIPACMVVGGGVAGMNAALCLAEQGFRVHLVEKSEVIGGLARRITEGFNGEDVQGYLEDAAGRIERHPLIEVHTGCQVAEVSGYVGNFTTVLSSGTKVKHGAFIIATGGMELKPSDYMYGQHPGVLTQLEMDEAVNSGDPRVRSARSVVFVQCVGSREEGRPYCSRICCTKTMKLAMKLKDLNPDAGVVVLYRDIRTYGFNEDLYREVRNRGVLFIRYGQDSKPLVRVEEKNNIETLFVTATDPIVGETLDIEADLLVLAAATVPSESNPRLSRLLKAPLNSDGFFLEAHMKLRPVDTAADGVFICGLAHSPKGIEGSIIQGKAAAGRAATILGRKILEAKANTAVVDQKKCAACLTCVRLCPYGAPRIKNYAAEIATVLCRGCGSCAGECPNKAITLQGYSDRQYNAMMDGLCH